MISSALEENPALQAQKLRLAKKMDASLLGKLGESDQVKAAIKNYELAFRMQASVPELTILTFSTDGTQSTINSAISTS